MQFNVARRELTLKVVYYGPALSGKTTNLQALHGMIPRSNVGRLMTLETRDDRTLFFDLLPVFFRTESGYKIKLKLFTVPGQVIHDSTRRIVIQGADAIAFIADSQLAETVNNTTSFKNLRANMKANRLPDDLPLVIQFNKRDLPGTRTDAALDQMERQRRAKIYRSVAISGEGVMETLEGLLGLTWDHLDHTLNIGSRLQLDRDAFLTEIFSGWRRPVGRYS